MNKVFIRDVKKISWKKVGKESFAWRHSLSFVWRPSFAIENVQGQSSTTENDHTMRFLLRRDVQCDGDVSCFVVGWRVRFKIRSTTTSVPRKTHRVVVDRRKTFKQEAGKEPVSRFCNCICKDAFVFYNLNKQTNKQQQQQQEFNSDCFTWQCFRGW